MESKITYKDKNMTIYTDKTPYDCTTLENIFTTGLSSGTSSNLFTVIKITFDKFIYIENLNIDLGCTSADVYITPYNDTEIKLGNITKTNGLININTVCKEIKLSLIGVGWWQTTKNLNIGIIDKLNIIDDNVIITQNNEQLIIKYNCLIHESLSNLQILRQKLYKNGNEYMNIDKELSIIKPEISVNNVIN